MRITTPGRWGCKRTGWKEKGTGLQTIKNRNAWKETRIFYTFGEVKETKVGEETYWQVLKGKKRAARFTSKKRWCSQPDSLHNLKTKRPQRSKNAQCLFSFILFN